MSDKKWAIVQDLSPFRVNIESQHDSRAMALWRAGTNPYVKVMPTAEAREADARLIEDAVRMYGESARPD